MSKRVVWVVEAKCGDEWFVFSRHDTRDEARREHRIERMGSQTRVVKYVPAETSKKAGGK